MDENAWFELGEKIELGLISLQEAFAATKDEAEHPEWWEFACACKECISCG